VWWFSAAIKLDGLTEESITAHCRKQRIFAGGQGMIAQSRMSNPSEQVVASLPPVSE
jgi:hypothetical protein